VVEQCVAEVVAQSQSTRVLDIVPILVHRHIRERLLTRTLPPELSPASGS
jgi:hypothetical protein